MEAPVPSTWVGHVQKEHKKHNPQIEYKNVDKRKREKHITSEFGITWLEGTVYPSTKIDTLSNMGFPEQAPLTEEDEASASNC